MKFFDVLNHIFNAVGWVKGWLTGRELQTQKEKRADAEAGLRVAKQKDANRERIKRSLGMKDLSDEEWLEEQRKK